MTNKVKSRGLYLGTSTDQISAKTFLGGFTPSNYIPAQVSTEGTDKVSSFLKGIDTKLGVARYTDQLFNGGSSPITVTTAPFLAGSLVDVYFSGVLMEEGIDWTRDTSNQQVILVTNETTSNSRIRVRVWA